MSRLATFFALAALVSVAAAPAAPEPAEARSLRVGGTPLQVVAESGSLWVLTCDRGCSGEARDSVGRIVRIDPRRGRVIDSVKLRDPGALAVGAGGVFATDFWRNTVRRFDPATLEPAATLGLVLPYQVVPGDDAFAPFDVAVGAGAVWVSTARGAVARIDRGARRVVAVVRLPLESTASVAAGERAVWVAAGLDGIYRIDPATNRVVARIRVGPADRRLDVERLALGAGHVFAPGAWVNGLAFAGGNGLARLDERNNRLESVTPLPSGPLAIAFGEGSLWVARIGGSQVERIDASTGKVVGRFRADVGMALAVAGGGLWTATRDGSIRRVAIP